MGGVYEDMNGDILKKILYAAPSEIRAMLLQEFYINPLEALAMFYECKTYEDIKKYRMKRTQEERCGTPSSFNSSGELTSEGRRLSRGSSIYAG